MLGLSMELPTITKSIYGATSNAMSFADHGAQFVGGRAFEEDTKMSTFGMEPQIDKYLKRPEVVAAQARVAGQVNLLKPKEKFMSRIVRVFIADPNPNVPIEQRVIYRSDEMHTDATDQELFFECNPAALLATHNESRTKMIDKGMTAARNKEVFLEPARIRDLKMVVVDVATF